MHSHSQTSEPSSVLAAQPIERIQLVNTEVIVLGTAHVSRASAEAVELLVQQESPDAVAIELDAGRLMALKDPESYKRLDLFEVIKKNQVGLVLANLALSAYQRRIAQESGIEPGAEMMAAVQASDAKRIPLWLVDRDVGLTLARCRAALGFWGGTKLMTELFVGSFSDAEPAASDIEKMKQSDVLQATFGQFREDSPQLYNALIHERDRFMALRVLQELQTLSPEYGPRKILLVLGAGHLAGCVKALRELSENLGKSKSEVNALLAQELAPLNAKPKPSIWPKLIGASFLIVLIGGLIYGFSKGFAVGAEFLKIYLGMTMGGTLLGALAARAHPLSALAATLAAPISVLHPLISSGMVSAVVELWLKRPTVSDFESLKVDLQEIKGFWRNRVARILTIFVFTNFGTAMAVWITSGWFIKKMV